MIRLLDNGLDGDHAKDIIQALAGDWGAEDHVNGENIYVGKLIVGLRYNTDTYQSLSNDYPTMVIASGITPFSTTSDGALPSAVPMIILVTRSDI